MKSVLGLFPLNVISSNVLNICIHTWLINRVRCPRAVGVGGYVKDSLRVFHAKCISILITRAVTRGGNPPIQSNLNTIDSPSVCVSSDFASRIWMAEYIH